MPPKCTSESKFFLVILLLFLINCNIITICCFCQLLSLESKFLSQKSAIKEIIIGIREAYTKYQIIYYWKFYCELNYIEYFW